MSFRPLSRPRPLYATCDSGAEELLASELVKLRCDQVEVAHRGVYFWGDQEALWRVNIYSRLANRVLIPLTEFPASNREELYAECKKIRWDWWVHTSQTIAVDASSHQSELSHTHFISQVVKDAVVDQLRERFSERPSVDARDPDLPINARISHNICTLSLDASGQRLHRRGYRIEGGPAPIKETLGSLLNHIAGWRPDEPIIDLTCGSGTLIIEAALRAQMTPPGWWRASRDAFAFQRWRSHSSHRFEEWRASASRPEGFPARFWGSDLDARQVKRARSNSARAGVESMIHWEVGDLSDQAPRAAQWLRAAESRGAPTPKSGRRALILMNLPYGQRLNGEAPEDERGDERGDVHDLAEAQAKHAELFLKLGAQLREHFSGCEAWLLVGEGSPWKEVRMKVERQVSLRNGRLPVKLVQIPLYARKPKT